MALAWRPSSSSAIYDDPVWKYEVFLSFRGADTRKGFTDHLYAALLNKGIITFKDDLDFERGKPIDDILEAIRESRFAVIVFSRDYASSTWCLEELETIYECMKQGKQKVFPIFYQVDPSDVWNQTGKYGEDLKKHEELLGDGGMDKVHRWKAAMKEVASISGWHLNQEHEAEFIQQVVKEMRSQLSKLSPGSTSDIFQNYVGMQSHLERMKWYLRMGESDEVRVIGICGMGGVGKSTIARMVHTKLASQFEGSSFLDDIRGVEEKHGLVHLQMQLLHDTAGESDIRIWNAYAGTEEIKKRLHCRRVLVVLDNVHDLRQLEVLAGHRDWFGRGSRIIITTRDNHLLDNYPVDGRYNVEGLPPGDALELFRKKAFPNSFPKTDHAELSHQFVHYARGLPLALIVLGSLVCGRSVHEWKDALCRLKKTPNGNILAILELSFNNLEEDEKNIFLDIACFFTGEKLEYVSEVVKSCGFCFDIGMRTLVDKNLITIYNNRVGMHDFLQQLGREIVLRESYEDPGQRSRLWFSKDIHKVLTNGTGTRKIEAISINQLKHEQVQENLSCNALKKMENLRLLKLKNFHLSKGIEHLSGLRYLEWHRYPFKSLPPKFQPVNLISLHLINSNITQLWKGIQKMESLEVLDLSYSQSLIKTPDLTGIPNLRKLILKGCKKLSKLHSSVGVLRRLVVLNLQDCKSLRLLPDSICDLKSLEVLDLRGCPELHELPERFGELTSLKQLQTTGGIYQSEPSSSAVGKNLIKKVFQTRKSAASGTKARWLLQRENPKPMALRLSPLSTLSCLRELHILDLDIREIKLPDELCCLQMLELLYLYGNSFESFPSSISQLSRLNGISCTFNTKLRSLPELPPGIKILLLAGCTSLEALPANLSQLPELGYLEVEFSTLLTQSLLEIPSSVKTKLCVNGTQAADNFYEALNLALVHPNFSLSAVVPGERIPSWFNYQYQLLGAESFPVKPVHLPSRWYNDRWIGFCICVAFRVHKLIFTDPRPIILPSILCGVQAPNTIVCLQRYATVLCTYGGSTEQLGFIFIPRGDLQIELDWNIFTHFCFDQSRLLSNGLVVASRWALRVVYESDVEELIRCNGFPDHDEGLLRLESDNDPEQDCWCHSSPADPLGYFFRFVPG